MPKKALIIATHHPPYSLASHPSSPAMTQEIDEACQAAGLWPDAFLSGHAHNYQFHLRRTANKQIPYFVAGTGGIQTQRVPPARGRPTDGATQGRFFGLRERVVIISALALKGRAVKNAE